MTTGYTSVLWRATDEDLGFWYGNLKAAQGELEKVSPEATQLEKTNLLMKLRQTLLDHGENGESVTSPSGISVFPNNTGLAFLMTVLGFLSVIGVVIVLAALND